MTLNAGADMKGIAPVEFHPQRDPGRDELRRLRRNILSKG